MALTIDGYFDWAKRDPGPPDKRYTELCLSKGIVFHSAVGYYQGWRSRLFSMERDVNDPTRYSLYAAASVTGFILYDGTLMQNYPIDISCWASGNRYANTHFNAFEEEGGYNPVNEPLREAQIITSVRIIRELSSFKGWTFKRLPLLERTGWEHNECVTIWGGSFTACPSSRIPWNEFSRRLEGNMADDELRRYMKVQGILLHAISDVTQHGLIIDPNIRSALIYFFGASPTHNPSTNREAVGALEYAAGQAAQLAAPNDGAKAIIRALANGTQVPADV